MRKFVINEEEKTGIFPIDKFEIYVIEDTYKEKKLFYVESDGLKLSVDCDTCEIVSGDYKESQLETYNYIANNIKRWSEEKNRPFTEITNLRQCQLVWDGLNGEQEEDSGYTIIDSLSTGFSLCIFGKDKGEPHVHVQTEEFDLTFTIETGELIETLLDDGDEEEREYIINSCPKWLDSVSSMNNKLTNREVSMLCWVYLHNGHVEGSDKDTALIEVGDDVFITVNETDNISRQFVVTYKGAEYLNSECYPKELKSILDNWKRLKESTIGKITNRELVSLLRKSLGQETKISASI